MSDQAAGGPPATVLVVDDSEAKRYLLASWLRRDGYAVAEAATGAGALAAIRERGADLVVLDIRLPDLSGTEVCERLKADPVTAVIPVIQVSAIHVASADRARGLQRGADAYLAEPIEPEEFLATVTAALRSSRARRQAEQSASRLKALTEVTMAINAAPTFDALARAAAAGAANIFAGPVGLVVVLPEGQLRRIRGLPGAEPRQMGGPVELAQTLADRVLDARAAEAVTSIPATEWHTLVPDTVVPGDACVAASRVRSDRAPVVLWVGAEVITGPEDRHVLLQLTQSTALALEALRAYANEHLIALTLQRSLLPAGLPKLPGVQLCARYVPASAQAEVGGDFYEVLERDGSLIAAIGDVQGHSLRAATVMGELRHALRAFADEGHPPVAMASLLNSVLQRYHPDIVATLCLVELDLATGTAEIVNCGHIPPLLVDPAAGHAQYRGQGGMLLGTPVDHPHAERVTVPPGGMLLMLTDGLIEERQVALDDNLERLRLAALEPGDPSLDAFTDRILALFGAREDDVALITLRRI
jgi:serine phosphatase RsbU (regulator of sigma subunit)/DNA-binding NarL/FixJ family response regulator